MAQQVKNMVSSIKLKTMVKIPAVIIEEQGYNKGSKVNILYGKNYTAVVILPPDLKLNDRMAERVNLLVNEQLT